MTNFFFSPKYTCEDAGGGVLLTLPCLHLSEKELRLFTFHGRVTNLRSKRLSRCLDVSASVDKLLLKLVPFHRLGQKIFPISSLLFVLSDFQGRCGLVHDLQSCPDDAKLSVHPEKAHRNPMSESAIAEGTASCVVALLKP